MKSNDKVNNKIFDVSIDHNSYKVSIYGKSKGNEGTIVFPVFHYQGDNQYIDLIDQLVSHQYRVITINLLNKGDKVLFFNYYFSVFKQFLTLLRNKEIILDKDEVTLLGFGVTANLVSYMNVDQVKVNRIILLSPINRYKGEYQINREIANFKTPTYIFYGQMDSLTNIDTRYSIFAKGKNNPKVKFTCYPCTGHFLYYDPSTSLELEKMYRNNDTDLLVGEDRKTKAVLLPAGNKLNELFFNHLFAILKDKPMPKRICLLTDCCPLFVNGVEMVVELLQKELAELGYETYIAALWEKNTDLSQIPNNFYIPISAHYAHIIPRHKDLMMLSNFNFARNARMLAMFGFNYLHLHTEYSMSTTALELAKITNIKMPYTYHTLWKLYYEHHYGKLVGEISYKAVKSLLFNKLYEECPVITVPSRKSYLILKNESRVDKDIRIMPSPINKDKFVFTADDRKNVETLRRTLHLKDKKVIGYVGRVSTEKNILETINYVAKIQNEIPNLVFVIVGVGDAVESLKKHVKKLKIEDKVVFIGQINNRDLKYYYRLFDAFVTASTFETQGLTYFEAAMCGTVIIAKEDEAIEGIFKDGVNAYVYKDFYQWTERIDKALYGDNKAIISAAKDVVKNYSQEKWAKNMVALYQELNPTK